MYELNPKDLRIETFWAPDQGAWSMKPGRVVRITHVPSGISVTEGSERSQHRNRVEAIRKMDHIFYLAPELFPAAVEEPGLPALPAGSPAYEFTGDTIVYSYRELTEAIAAAVAWHAQRK